MFTVKTNPSQRPLVYRFLTTKEQYFKQTKPTDEVLDFSVQTNLNSDLLEKTRCQYLSKKHKVIYDEQVNHDSSLLEFSVAQEDLKNLNHITCLGYSLKSDSFEINCDNPEQTLDYENDCSLTFKGSYYKKGMWSYRVFE